MINWKNIFKDNRLACYELYKWVRGGQALEMNYFTHQMFMAVLMESNYFTNEERIFDFFDECAIYCDVSTNGYKKFIATTISEYRCFVCNDYTDRVSGIRRNIENAFDLLDERIEEITKRRAEMLEQHEIQKEYRRKMDEESKKKSDNKTLKNGGAFKNSDDSVIGNGTESDSDT